MASVRPASPALPDLERFSLSRFLQEVEAAGELEIRRDPIELADVAGLLEGRKHATLLENVGPEGARLAGNVVGSRSRLALAFGTTEQGLLDEILRRLEQPPEFVEVERAAAPVQQVVLTDDADLTALPVHLQHGLDGAPYISASVDIVRDPQTGLTNVGMRRLMLRGRRVAGIDLQAPSDLKAIYEAASRCGEPLPIAFVVGSHPADQLAATLRAPVDELGLVASLRDAPLPVVKCVTNDLMVPADAEYVLEGYLDPAGHVEPEGPYGEFLGYYGGLKRNPLFRLTAITHRRNPIFQTCTIGGRLLGRTDSAQLMALRTEVIIWRALETAVREPVAVYATTSSGGSFNVRIALRQRVPGEARNAIAAVFGSLGNVKHVFVVDPDIDIFSDEQMDWALATRFQADRDFVVESGFRVVPLDPSLLGARTGAKGGFDCTLPPQLAASVESRVPEPPTYPGRRFDSLEAALTDGPKSFQELMAALASRDGREIVRALEELDGRRGLTRDEDGRWRLRG